MQRGIDVSRHNGDINWQAIVAAGIDFVIVRSSYGLQSKDERFIENVNGARAVGLKVGAYHYSYSLAPQDALLEAANCLAAIKPVEPLDLPLFFDMEDGDGYKKRKGFSFEPLEITAICQSFLKHIERDCGIYASYSWLTDYIDWRSLGCAVWNAQWGEHDKIKGYMWQYTDQLKIAGQIFDGNIKYE